MPPAQATSDSAHWRRLTLGLGFLFVFIGLFTFRDYGMSWDQTTRWTSGDIKVKYFQQLAEAEDKSEFIRTYFTDNYPGLYDMSLSLLSKVLPTDRLSIDQFMSFSFAVLLFAAVVGVSKTIGNWQLAFFAGLFLLCMPRVYGHAFINPKDIPFAATYWLALLSLFAYATNPARLPSWPKTILCGLAIGACLATRIAGLVLFAYLGLIIVRNLWVQNRNGSPIRPMIMGWLARGPVIVAIAYCVLIPLWPGIHKSPFGASAAILEKLHSVSNAIPLFYQGRTYAAGDLPPLYAFGITWVTTPIFLLLLLAIGAIVSGIGLSKPIAIRNFLQSPAALLAFVLVFPFAYISIKQPYIHNGTRHLLFALPAIAIGSAAALCWLKAQLRNRFPRFHYFPNLAVFAFVAIQSLWMYSFHPYQYVYFNSFAGGPEKARFNYEFEYWFTANREALTSLIEKLESNNDPRIGNGHSISLLVAGPIETVRYFADNRFSFTTDPKQADFYIAGTTLQTHELIQAPVYLTIERNGIPLTVIKELKQLP